MSTKEEKVCRLAMFFEGIAFGLRNPEAFQLEQKGYNSGTFEAFNAGLEAGEAIREDVITGRRPGLTVTDIIELELEKKRLNYFI